jgi:hypothetical protein
VVAGEVVVVARKCLLRTSRKWRCATEKPPNIANSEHVEGPARTQRMHLQGELVKIAVVKM